jgi:hypothetical protein
MHKSMSVFSNSGPSASLLIKLILFSRSSRKHAQSGPNSLCYSSVIKTRVIAYFKDCFLTVTRKLYRHSFLKPANLSRFNSFRGNQSWAL